MPIEIEQLPDESIIVMTVTQPFDPGQDMEPMFKEITRMRLAMEDEVVQIIDLKNSRMAFSQTVVTMAEAARGIKASKAAGLKGPPTTVFIGSGMLADLTSKAMEQRQYGGVKGRLCANRDEALTLAREILAAKKERKSE